MYPKIRTPLLLTSPRFFTGPRSLPAVRRLHIQAATFSPKRETAKTDLDRSEEIDEVQSALQEEGYTEKVSGNENESKEQNKLNQESQDAEDRAGKETQEALEEASEGRGWNE